MNIYVDQMPESCECCPCNDDYYRCGLSGDLFDYDVIHTRRMNNCKLKQLDDVVEVVSCKDCKRYNTDDCFMIHGKKMNRNLFDDDFCSYGEKRDD